MILYRSIGQHELTALLLDEHVHGRYNNSTEKQNDNNLTKVCCFFEEKIRWVDGSHEFFIKVDVPDGAIVGKGVGIYYAPKSLKDTHIWTGRHGTVEYRFNEVYVSEYNLCDIKEIEGLHKFTDSYINKELKPIFEPYGIQII